MKEADRVVRQAEGRAFYERVCNLTGTEFDESTVCYHHIEGTKYHITLFHQKFYRHGEEFHKVSMTLVWNNSEIVGRFYLKVGTSDKVVMKRFQKLMDMAEV